MPSEVDYCCMCGCEFEADHHNVMDGLGDGSVMCDDCMVEDAE